MAVPGVEPAETWARALAAAAVLGGMALDRIGGYSGERARALLGAWQDQPREMRARVVARTVAEVRAPIPANSGRVHRDWIRFEDARAREAWESRRGDAVGVWYQRRITAAWVALPMPGRWLCAGQSAEEIRAFFRRRGISTIASATMPAGDAAVARVAATLSPEDGVELVERVKSLKQDKERTAAREAAAMVQAHGPDPVRIGAAWAAKGLLKGEEAIQVRLIVGPALARWIDGEPA